MQGNEQFIHYRQQYYFEIEKYNCMGNSQDKPAQKQQSNNKIQSQQSQNQLPYSNQDMNNFIQMNVKDGNSIKNQSRGPSGLGNNPNNSRGPSGLGNNPNTKVSNHHSNRNSNRNSPQLRRDTQNNSIQSLKSNNKQNPLHSSSNPQNQQQDQNQFMPLLKLQPTGQIRLRITLLQLKYESKPKGHLKKNTSLYNSTMNWKKDNRNVFYFSLKEDQGYQLKMQVDIQGNQMGDKEWFWVVLCPINVPFGQTVKVGQMNCVNVYKKLEFQENQIGSESDLGPSIKNIDFKVSEQTYQKWGEPIPKSFYSQPNIQAVKKVFDQPQQKFTPYRQISRYFDSSNKWRASTYFEQTLKQFKAWIIEVTDHNSILTISKELHNDLKRRQTMYTKFMFDNIGAKQE